MGRYGSLYGHKERVRREVAAEHAVKGIEGVESVNSQFRVLPLSPMTTASDRGVDRSILRAARVARYGLRRCRDSIIVNNGRCRWKAS